MVGKEGTEGENEIGLWPKVFVSTEGVAWKHNKEHPQKVKDPIGKQQDEEDAQGEEEGKGNTVPKQQGVEFTKKDRVQLVGMQPQELEGQTGGVEETRED